MQLEVVEIVVIFVSLPFRLLSLNDSRAEEHTHTQWTENGLVDVISVVIFNKITVINNI